MPDDNPEERKRPRHGAISPELRKFLGPAPTAGHETSEETSARPASPPPSKPVEPKPAPVEQAKSPDDSGEIREPEAAKSRPRPSGGAVALAPAKELSRKVEMGTAFLIIGGLVALLGTFYVGKKFDYIRAMIAARNRPNMSDIVPDKFQGISADELVEQALAAERLGNWQEAAERFVVAKRKNLGLRGILFRAGKLHYEHGDFVVADKFFEKAVAFGENVDTASFLRGLMAMNSGNYPGAEHFFETAAAAEPFIPAYPFYWAETLRREHQPAEAIPIYHRALRRFDTETDRTVCSFKIRMSMLEAGQTATLGVEVDAKQAAAPLPVDWLMTQAAMWIREGKVDDAVPLIEKARTNDRVNLYSQFASCAGDMFFAGAAAKNPDIAEACKVQTLSLSPGQR